MDLVKKLFQGDERSAARLISLIEEGSSEGFEAIRLIYPHVGSAQKIGITGSPGAGKSTLTGKLAAILMDEGRHIGVIAVDPSSPEGGGALLGDRVRMGEADKTGRVFIRSMAHRGYPGGIAKAAIGATYILEGLGKDTIIVESIGAGQAEIQISVLCDTIVTVVTSGYGDEIQLMKTGLIEIGDIIVVNKADKPGAQEVVQDISIHFSNTEKNGWKIPVVAVSSLTGEGFETLKNNISRHFDFLKHADNYIDKKREHLKTLMLSLLKEEIWDRTMNMLNGSEEFKLILDGLKEKRIDPYEAVRRTSEIAFKHKILM
ncbi:MAG TPA: methylmalonyl Co-A mutase-associated GTPase MeaB [Syntrophorhabdaceae bacterium]|nr:methylmalonyl Co-A mutase-associated GTPase MeaB [Syntrophorhabdaceae bacterium]